MGEHTLSSLLEDIDLERIALPEIQREYVWSEQKARDLVDSLYKKFPVGVILLWRPTQVPIYKLLTSQSQNTKDPDWLILDGQQRLTSLDKIKKADIKICFNIDDETFHIENRAISNDPKWVRVDDVWNNESTHISQKLAQDLGLSLEDVYKKYVPRIQKLAQMLNQSITVFEIREDDYARIAEMYMRLNEKGTKLKKAEIHLALIVLRFPSIFSKQISELVDKFEEWDIDTNFFLRCFVCISTNQSKFEPMRKYLETTTKEEISGNIKKVSTYLDGAFEFIDSHFGINENNNKRLIPSRIVLITLMLYLNKQSGRITTREELHALTLWFFCASHYGRYSGSTESSLTEDIRLLAEHDPIGSWLDKIKSSRGGLKINELNGRINDTNRFALYYALRQNNALDWWTGSDIKDTDIEYHHIFPKKVLKDAGIADAQINDIRNIAIVSRRANRRISSMKPESYFESEIGDMNRVFSQFVPEDPRYWKVENYQIFLEEREKNILGKLNQRITELGAS